VQQKRTHYYILTSILRYTTRVGFFVACLYLGVVLIIYTFPMYSIRIVVVQQQNKIKLWETHILNMQYGSNMSVLCIREAYKSRARGIHM